jgi:hypothetical protein
MESDILFVESDFLSYSGKLLKTDSLDKIQLSSHFAELPIVRTEQNCYLVKRNGGSMGCLQSGE